MLVTALIATIASVMLMAAQAPSLRVDGVKVASDVPPVTSLKGEAYVPLRAVAEALGAVMNYDEKTRAIELVRENDRLTLHVGERRAVLNGNPMTLHHSPFAVRTSILARAAS